MRRRQIHPVFLASVVSCLAGTAIAMGCAATDRPGTVSTGAGGQGGTGGSTSGNAGGNAGGGMPAASSGAGGTGGGLVIDAGDDAPPDVLMNPCGTACGLTELCDAAHLGLDDDCDGEVDETCPCSTGEAHFCFKGDPSYHNAPGCYDGTQKCTELGTWGGCLGGQHAIDDCSNTDLTACHAISALPFGNVDLKDGTGTFSADAVPGTETWTVACPMGVSPCPSAGGMNPPDDFKPLQSGEYTITYTKGTAGGTTDSCTYPLYVGARGLRIELEWEHDLGGDGVDLDLHLLQPNSQLPWSIYGAAQDCGYSSCLVTRFMPPVGMDVPHWFSDTAMPPDPVNWYLDPLFSNNTCYFAPRGVGLDWQALALGCHNPRLDLDNRGCDPTIVDPDHDLFCAPENINIDYPPKDEWLRIGVHYYSNNLLTYDVHPRVKIYCDGALAGELGPSGFYVPESPIMFAYTDGDDLFGTNRFWVVADVAFTDDQCQARKCVLKPAYENPSTKTPFFTIEQDAEMGFEPPYPPLPP